MEKSTVIGMVLGFVSVFVGMVLKGAAISSLNNPAAFLIIFGGTFSCLFTGFTMEQMRNFPKLVKKVFQSQDNRPKTEMLSLFVELSQIARREGILALENKVADIKDPFFRSGLNMDVVSRGGSFITGWMLHNEKENPLYERYDDILDICQKYDSAISLGDGLRPGCLADATDRAQIQELITLGELVDRAWARGVQVLVEGPGHVPFDQIAANMKLQKQLCRNAPFYVLGPLVTDVAPGYDHITAAIGGTMAAVNGADFLCYVTPAEHLALPTMEDVHEGVITSRIAAHAADVVKNIPGARDWDLKMAEARKTLDWEQQLQLAIDPEKARKKRAARNEVWEEACSMCGDYCAVKIVGEYLGKALPLCHG